MKQTASFRFVSIAMSLGLSLSCFAALSLAQEAPSTLVAALEELRASGLRIIYSSDLVRADMMVKQPSQEPTLHGTLRELLSPHGLAAAVGPEGTVLVVRDTTVSPTVEIESPVADQSVFGRVHLIAKVDSSSEVSKVQFLLDDEVIATRFDPPWEAWVEAGPANRDRRFSVVAFNRIGLSGQDNVVTLRVPVDESYFVTLRELSVTVSKNRRRILGLEKRDFELIDGDVVQKVETFSSGELPVTAALLLDASESMRGEPLRAAIEGGRAFLRQLMPEDRSMAMLFSDRTLAISPLSEGRADLDSASRLTEAIGSTALNDHLYAALDLLGRSPGRRVVVLFSDGADVVSVLGIRDVLWKVRRSDAMIYWIQLAGSSVGGSFTSSWRNLEANRKEWEGLERAVEESGGRIDRIEDIREIDQAFAGVLEELRQQYVLGYYPQGRSADGTWRKVRVRVNLPGARVRVRSGYVDG